MTDIERIRALISDQGVYVREDADRQSLLSFQVTYMPLLAKGSAGVIITLEDGTLVDPLVNAYSVDLQTGVVTFTGTVPAAQQFLVEYLHVSLTDITIQALLDLNADSPDPIRLAAADGLDAIADSQAMIEKKIRLLDMDTDGPALARAFRDHAATLRKLVFSPDFEENTFDLVEQINADDAPAWWEKVKKDWLRVLP